MKRIVIVGIMLMALAGCSKNNEFLTHRGRVATLPVGRVDNSRADVIQMPDRFGNIATKCNPFVHGQRIYSSTQGDTGFKVILIVADENCP